MPRNIAPTRIALYLLVILISAGSAEAQSGRRQPKPPDVAPVPTPTPEPTQTPKRQKDDPGIGFLVTMYAHETFANYPLSFATTVMHSCAERLRDGSSATVDVSEQDVNRGEAAKKAKSETRTYVVWLQLTTTTMGSSVYANYSDLELEYVVFEPGSGKVATSGRSYQNGNRKGPIVVGPASRGSNNAIYTEQLLKYAAEDAADRILKALHLSIGDPNHPVVTNL